MIIGIVGLIGSGKGTVGDILVKEAGFISESFAKPLKDAVAIIFNWPRHLLEGDTKESREWREKVDEFWSKELGWKVTPRAVLQKMGTEAGRRVFGDPLWTSALINRLDSNQNYVVTDVRFANEIETIKRIGHVVRVVRGPNPEWISYAKIFLDEHPLETEMPWKGEKIHISEYGWVNSTMDYVITNNGTLDKLSRDVKDLYRLLSR